MTRRSHLRTAAAAVAVTTAAAGAVAAFTTRRWSRTLDPTGGEPLTLPDGEDVVVTAPDGAQIAVRVAGPADGPPTLLLHGWTNDRRVWGPVGKRLVEQGHRVVLYDQRGHGASTTGEDGLSIESLAGDLDAVVTQLDLRDAVVVGHSMGGMATQAFAVTHRQTLADRVSGLVLVSSACDRVHGGGAKGIVTDLPISDWALALSVTAPMLVRYTVGRQAHIGHLRAVRDLFVATPPKVRKGLRAAMMEMDLSEDLRHIDVPVTIVVGTHDQLLPQSRSRRIAELIPHAELRVLEDRGHMLPWEAMDELTDLIVAAATAPTIGASA